MKIARRKIHRLWVYLLIAAGVGGVMFLTLPSSLNYTRGRDQGVFLYIGQRILEGHIPYRDVWDHKPPIIFYLNALGLALGAGSRMGVWVIEVVSLFCAALIGFVLIRKALGTLAAVFSLFLWLAGLVFVLSGGNWPAEYALPLQFLCLWLGYTTLHEGKRFASWRGFWLGVVSGLALCLLQTTLGITAAIVLYLSALRLRAGQFRVWRDELLTIGVGGLSVVGVVALYFASQGALGEFWAAAVQYNLAYVAARPIDRLISVVSGVEELAESGLGQIAGLGYVSALAWFLLKKEMAPAWRPLTLIGLLDLPIEVVLANLSGRNYTHYYISWLPGLAIFAGFLFYLLLTRLFDASHPPRAATLFTVVILGLFSWLLATGYYRTWERYRRPYETSVVEAIQRSTRPDEYVLMWGAETRINFIANRRSPTRFVYQYPLYHPNYTHEALIVEFLDDILDNQPRLIIDTKNDELPLFSFPINTPAIQSRLTQVRSQYRVKEEVGGWTVYERDPLILTPRRP